MPWTWGAYGHVGLGEEACMGGYLLVTRDPSPHFLRPLLFLEPESIGRKSKMQTFRNVWGFKPEKESCVSIFCACWYTLDVRCRVGGFGAWQGHGRRRPVYSGGAEKVQAVPARM